MDNDSNAIVKLENVWVQYNSVVALEDVTMSVAADDFIGIIGPNGGGKSTLLKVLLGLVKHTRGKIEIFGTTPQKANKKIGYVAQYQNFDRNFPIDVWNVVLMGRLGHAGLLHRYSQNDHMAAEQALKTVGMFAYRNRHISQLSGGQQQRVLIARALTIQPALLLLDEPLSNVDSSMQKGFYDLLIQLNKSMAIMMVSHDIASVAYYVKKIACLNKRLYYHGSEELTTHDLEETYQCPIELIAHGVPHRVLKDHQI